MQFLPVFRWISDEMPETTEAVVVVSRCGVVKCLPYRHWNQKNQGYSNRAERVYPLLTNRGKQRKQDGDNKYQYVCIREKTYAVHRLVALAWIPNPEGKPHVNHKNGIKHENNADNLEWMTNLENRRHAMSAGLPRKSIEKITDEQVAEAKRLRSMGYGICELGEMYGVTGECIRHRVKNISTDSEIDHAKLAVFQRRRANG